MALSLSKLFLKACIAYLKLPHGIAKVGVSSLILQKKLKQKNIRQFRVSQWKSLTEFMVEGVLVPPFWNMLSMMVF